MVKQCTDSDPPRLLGSGLFAARPEGILGSLPDGTLCFYCGKNRAGYIFDGCVGPLCSQPGRTSCYDLSQGPAGWEGVVLRRLMKFARARFARLAPQRHLVWTDESFTFLIVAFLLLTRASLDRLD